MIITDDDIGRVEKKFKISFDEERKRAIKNLETVDIVACAGSGKTTLMCSKIDILTSKQPFEGNKGVAVLSLTNVAIEQIRFKLGKNHSVFKYPNFCETMQKFVTSFVLNGWIATKYNRKIESIDNGLFIQYFKSKMNRKKVLYLERVNFSFEDVYSDGENVFYREQKIENIKISNLTAEKKKEYIESIKMIKLQLISEGIFNYRDAFEISTKYLKENNKLKEFIKNRFQICFVDEMQDCRKWEKDFLEECFSDVCFQKIGDPNQQIYDETYWQPTKKIIINNSIRNSVNIAEFANKFEDVSNNMTGRIQNNIKVKFLVYNSKNILKVKSKYIEEIKKENLEKIDSANFKMIGKIAKKNEGKIELIDYCDSIKEEESNNYDKLFLERLKQNKNKVLITLYEMMYYVYRKIDKNNYLRINNKNEFNDRISLYINNEKIYRDLRNSKYDILSFSKKFIENILINLFTNKEYFKAAYKSILDEKTIDVTKIFNFEENGLKIETKTIAGVKGETHTATLVCETFYRNYDIEYILENYIRQNKNNKTVKEILHTLYVAFTRPTDMLCIAIREEVYCKYKEEINSLNAEIINIEEEKCTN